MVFGLYLIAEVYEGYTLRFRNYLCPLLNGRCNRKYSYEIRVCPSWYYWPPCEIVYFIKMSVMVKRRSRSTGSFGPYSSVLFYITSSLSSHQIVEIGNIHRFWSNKRRYKYIIGYPSTVVFFISPSSYTVIFLIIKRLFMFKFTLHVYCLGLYDPKHYLHQKHFDFPLFELTIIMLRATSPLVSFVLDYICNL